MASAKSVALRQQAAVDRLLEGFKGLHVRVDEDALRSPVSDPEVKLANVLEVMAGAVERAARKAEKAEAAAQESDEPTITEPEGVIVAAVETEPTADAEPVTEPVESAIDMDTEPVDRLMVDTAGKDVWPPVEATRPTEAEMTPRKAAKKG